MSPEERLKKLEELIDGVDELKAENLMIGNFVFRKKLIFNKWDKEKYNLISVRPNDIVAFSLSPDKFKPIPLTEENIVELLGFEKVQKYFYLKDSKLYNLRLTFKKSEILFGLNYKIPLPKHVHKLQQLIKSLEE